MPIYERRTLIKAPAAELFAWHTRPGALERLVPPWEHVRVVERSGGIENGARTVIQMRKGPLRLRWVAVHRDYQEGRQFVDEQVKGPFKSWHHTHRVIPADAERSFLEDEIAYRLPLGALGRRLAGSLVARDLDRGFLFRHRRTADDIARHREYPGRAPLRIVLSGASGLIGRNLTAFLTTGGHEVIRLVRRPPHPGASEARWDPATGAIDSAALDGADAVVHLSGRSLVAPRWTGKVKREIWDSREASTRLLCESLAKLSDPPRTLIAASAIGFYGNRGDHSVSEASPPGAGFLAELCQAWEAATQPASAAGIRVANLRIGLVLTASGGLLDRILLPFQLGLGGALGSGRQYMSWIALDDLLGSILHLLRRDDLAGPINAVAPNPVTNRVFTKALGRVIRRPTILPAPAPVLKALFGELGQALFLDGARVAGDRLADSGFRFNHPQLEGALRFELGR
ncbi:MAG: TIGR01777 family oxidoreductase [Gemmatimonadota bacterium]|nr:MAG: TIGR01777 family oxidoreductase [Gemmatimonadota bacterium]